MIDLENWLAAYMARMEAAFGERITLLGLQGSYRRGEATEESDIDLVAVLDRVELEDLRRYRALIREMPEGEKACGFIAGVGELRGWPRWDLYQLAGDVRVLRGQAEAVFPPFTAADAQQAAREGAAALYHAACHGFLYGEASGGALAELYKGAFFVLRAAHDARTGYRAVSRRDLLPRLAEAEREILAASIGREALRGAEREALDEGFRALIRWCGKILEECGGDVASR